jgi:glycosyltransferase involved in cell wall biosynthesis
MKIGVVVDNDLNSDKRVLREIRILKDDGNEIYVLCFEFSGKVMPEINGIDITRIRISRRMKNILFFFMNLFPAYESMWSKAIRKLITEHNIEALHVHDLYMSRAAHRGIAGSGRKIPMVLDLHENYPFAVTTYNWTKGLLRGLFSLPQQWKKKEKEYLEYADRIIVLSEEFRDDLTARYQELDGSRFLVFPNVPGLSDFNERKHVDLKVNIRKIVTVVLYFGVVAERRGIFDALNVFTELASEKHPSVLLIIGPVDKQDSVRFREIINSEILRETVYYIPWIDVTELPAYLEITDICIAPFHKNPQHESGVANKIFDYMLGKKPVIASDCRPQMNLIEKYNCGIVYKDLLGFKNAIEKLASDPDLRSEMGNNGFKAIINENNSGLFKERLTGLFRDIIRVRD